MRVEVQLRMSQQYHKRKGINTLYNEGLHNSLWHAVATSASNKDLLSLG